MIQSQLAIYKRGSAKIMQHEVVSESQYSVYQGYSTSIYLSNYLRLLSAQSILIIFIQILILLIYTHSSILKSLANCIHYKHHTHFKIPGTSVDPDTDLVCSVQRPVYLE